MSDSSDANEPTKTTTFPWGWVLGAAIVVAGVLLLLYATAEPENTLPDVYSVM